MQPCDLFALAQAVFVSASIVAILLGVLYSIPPRNQP
jgi:hypothetical protein